MNNLPIGEINWQPTLQNELARLEPLEQSDFDRLFRIAADPLIWEQHPSKDRYKQDVFLQFFDGAVISGSAFLIFDNKTGELTGSTRFYDYDPERKSIAIGYTFLSRAYWGGPFNRAVKTLLLDYAFNQVNTVIFHIGSTNLRSQKAILKLGAVKTRELRMDFNSGTLLHYEYEIRKTDWVAANSATSDLPLPA